MSSTSRNSVAATLTDYGPAALQKHEPSLNDLVLAAPTLRTIFAVLIFLLASGAQHDCHAYLAHLKNTKPKSGTRDKTDKTNGPAATRDDGYKLPTHPAFQSLIAPHYFAECLIYLSLALVAAPERSWMNWTLASALVFVAVNLGVTAGVTKEWYERRFGKGAVRGKWRMVPGVW